MLDKIPHEIVLVISSLLTFKDKVMLITTCRHLYNLISNTNLYSELDLFKHTEGMEDILGMFKDKPYFGEQVRVFSIDLASLSDRLLVQIRTIFPNITRFKTPSDDTIEGITYQHYYSTNTIVQWSNTIQEYDIVHDWPGILPSLETVTYPQLTCLKLGDYSTLDDPDIAFDADYYLPVIKNAPSLKWLQLPTAINLEFLEELHSSCRQLESLTLPYSEVFIRDDRLNHPIVPADSLLYLNIDEAHCFDKNGLLLDYISAKYRCLNQLDFSSRQLFKDNDFDFYLDYMDGNTTDAEESFRIEFEDTRVAYRESFARFFSKLSKSIESLSFRLDSFDEMYSYRVLSTSLTRFKLQRGSESIPIYWILSVFPSLQELCLWGNIKLDITGNSLTQHFPNLVFLTSRIEIINQEFLDFLKVVAPNIQKMHISISHKIEPRELSIDISEWELKQLNISIYPLPYYFNITIQSMATLIKYGPIMNSLAVVEDTLGFDSNEANRTLNIKTTKEKHFKLNGSPISILHDKIVIS